MFNFLRNALIYSFCFALSACTQVDDYLLGKDNTLKPKSLPNYHPTVHLKEQWSTSIGKTDYAGYLKLKPVVVDRTVYVADSKGRVLAFDKLSGQSLWQKQLSQQLVSGPVVMGDDLVLGTNNASVILLASKDGQQRWESSVSGDVLASPLLTKQSVIVKTIDGRMYAFDRVSGKKRWSVVHGSPSLILRASSSPVKVHHSVLVGFSDGKFDALDIDTGHMLWQRSIAYASGSSDVERLVDIDADPLVSGNIVYLASYQGYVGAMSLESGEFIWNKPASTYNNLAQDDQYLYLADSSDVVMAFMKKSGHMHWKQTALKARGLSAPAQVGSYVIVGDKTGYIHVLDSEQGNLVGGEVLNAPITVAPVVSEGRIYVLTNSGQLTCFKLER